MDKWIRFEDRNNRMVVVKRSAIIAFLPSIRNSVLDEIFYPTVMLSNGNGISLKDNKELYDIMNRIESGED